MMKSRLLNMRTFYGLLLIIAAVLIGLHFMTYFGGSYFPTELLVLEEIKTTPRFLKQFQAMDDLMYRTENLTAWLARFHAMEESRYKESFLTNSTEPGSGQESSKTIQGLDTGHGNGSGQVTTTSNVSAENAVIPLDFEDAHAHHDDNVVAKALYEKVRVLCWVMTSPNNLETKAKHVRDTWGKRCNIMLFMSSKTDPSFPTIGLEVVEGRSHLTAKTIQAFLYVFKRYYNEADWFLKADDDTYVILENLRYFLKDKNTSEPIFFGHHFKPYIKQGYFSGGAGYILSKEALHRFASKSDACRQDGGAEDVEIGRCMQRIGVKAGNSTDRLGRSRFHCFTPRNHIHGKYPDWYLAYDANGAKKNAISDYAITFHYVKPEEMYEFEFFVYHLRPYGIESNHQELN